MAALHCIMLVVMTFVVGELQDCMMRRAQSKRCRRPEVRRSRSALQTLALRPAGLLGSSACSVFQEDTTSPDAPPAYPDAPSSDCPSCTCIFSLPDSSFKRHMASYCPVYLAVVGVYAVLLIIPNDGFE